MRCIKFIIVWSYSWLYFFSAPEFPRYVRVNTLLASVSEVLSQLQNDGWQLIEYDINDTSYEQYIDLVNVRLVLFYS